jgi:hypothetical protein
MPAFLTARLHGELRTASSLGLLYAWQLSHKKQKLKVGKVGMAPLLHPALSQNTAGISNLPFAVYPSTLSSSRPAKSKYE